MANIKSQKKRIITNEKSRMRNRAVKSELKTATRRVKAAVAAGGGGAAGQDQNPTRLLQRLKVGPGGGRAAVRTCRYVGQGHGVAARLAEMNAASEEKAKRREKQLKEEAAAQKRKAKEAEEAAKAEAAEGAEEAAAE